ncbi:serine--tRNA ligase, partial [Candidatus Berkelbacteria bacterium CG03_land_8_20_14_0_80_40_36]
MLDIKFIRENQQLVKEGAENKGIRIDLGRVLELNKELKDLREKIDNLRKQRNDLAKKRDIEKGKQIKQELAGAEPKLRE